MIPEIESENRVALSFRRKLHQALRRRTWCFKRNARLNELLPQSPVRRPHPVWNCALPALLALLCFRA